MQSWGMRMCLPVEGTSESRLATDVQGSKSVIEMPAAMVLSSRYRSLPRLWTSVKCHFSLAQFSPTTIPCFSDYSRRWGGECREEQRERVRESDRNRAVIGFHLHTVNFHHLDLVINLIRSIKKSHFHLHYRLAYIIALVIYIFRPLPFFCLILITAIGYRKLQKSLCMHSRYVHFNGKHGIAL